MCSSPIGPVGAREQEVAGLVEGGGLALVDEEPRAFATASESSSRAVATLEPTALTWAPGASQAPWTTGSREEVTVQTMSAPRDGFLDRLAGRDGDAVALGLAVGEALGPLERLAGDADPLDRPHREHRLQVRAGLDARADEREVAGVRPRENPRGEAADRRGPHRGDRTWRR